MAGKIMTGLLPKLSRNELSEVYSLYELVDGESSRITYYRPVRMIGPNTTVGKLLGNTQSVTPGEMALANRGILFADEENNRKNWKGLSYNEKNILENLKKLA